MLILAIGSVQPVAGQTRDDERARGGGGTQSERSFAPFDERQQPREQGRGVIRSEPRGGDVSTGNVPRAERRDRPNARGSPTQGRRGTSGGSARSFGTDPSNLAPYGRQLFTDRTPVDRTVSVNPSYEIKPGDRIAVELYGARTFSQVLTVDQKGNIFLPMVGPVELEGVPNARLQQRVQGAVHDVYTQDVEVYTNLLGTQPIGVYVTGAVKNPGHYPGSREDTLLYYLARAGGVDPDRGSYRRIEVKRDGRTIATADLYDFLQEGKLPGITFQNNDTVLVRQRDGFVAVSGDVRNSYLFEIPAGDTSGSRIADLSSPVPKASHVLVRGNRDGQSFSTYLPIQQFQNFRLRAGDEVVFTKDTPPQEIVVSVVGNSGGPSRFTLPRGAELGTLANLVEVNPKVARLDAMYLRRDSVAQRQKQAIERALYRLQKRVLTSPSTTTSESEIRSEEAKLVQQFIKDAKALEPEGRVVLADAGDWRDVQLRDGDELVIPEESDIVLISGEVQVPQTVLYDESDSIRDYVAAAGGVTDRGDADNVIVVRADGSVHDGSKPIRPGDHLMVLPGEGSKIFAIAKDIVEVVFQSAISAATVVNATNN